MDQSRNTQAKTRTQKVHILTNYSLLAAASSAAFLLLSLRLIPSFFGFILLLLQSLTVASSAYSLSRGTQTSSRAHGCHTVCSVMCAILQGAVSMAALTRPYELLVMALRSYVRTDDGVGIVRMVGWLCFVVFLLEWVGIVLGFVIRCRAVDGYEDKGENRVGSEEVAGPKSRLVRQSTRTTSYAGQPLSKKVKVVDKH